MQIIRHRRNLLDEIEQTDPAHGVEIDLRSDGGNIIMVHDAFKPGPRFEDWLAVYRHGLLILNTKEDGLETQVSKVLAAKGMANYFFLDLPMPTIVRLARSGERRSALRISEYEPISGLAPFDGLVDWVWIDSFDKLAFSPAELISLQRRGFKLCLVSPELQGRWDEEEVLEMRRTFRKGELRLDAVCTKRPELWQDDAA